MIKTRAGDIVGKTPQRVLRVKDVLPLVGVSRDRLCVMIKVGAFPRPFRLVPGGQAVGWHEGTVAAWQAQRAQDTTGRAA